MKKILSVLLLIGVICAGCSTQYSMTLNNGDVITSRGKPKFNRETGRYYYTDPHGQAADISASKVREISPSSMADQGGARFLPK